VFTFRSIASPPQNQCINTFEERQHLHYIREFSATRRIGTRLQLKTNLAKIRNGLQSGKLHIMAAYHPKANSAYTMQKEGFLVIRLGRDAQKSCQTLGILFSALRFGEA